MGWANFHDSVNHGLPEGHIGIVLEAISKEFKQSASFLRYSVVELAHGLNCLNFELYAKIREVCADLFQEFLHLILIASL